MLPALSEPVALPPGRAVRIERVHQHSSDPLPERFLHFHGPAELVFMDRGTGTFISETGEWAVGPGSLVHVPGMAIHDFAFAPGERGWTLVQFDPLAVDPAVCALPAPDKPLGLGDAASLCSLSPTYFSRLFAKTFGSGFVTYQTRLRLQRAARMLATGELPVSQIGYRTGFASHAYFSHCYRATFGVSPTQHRKMLLAGRGAKG